MNPYQPLNKSFPGKLIALIFILTSFSFQAALSQLLRGKITDNSGLPVQYATVFVQELKQGTASNTRGDYEIRLPSGKYTLFYQSLGYEPAIVVITITDSIMTRDIVLAEQFYEIPEVLISPSGEDPAYSIMRRAIGLAPYHLNQVSYYRANVYLKGNLFIKKIPRLIQRSMRMSSSEKSTTISAGTRPSEGEQSIKEGDSYFLESFNEIEFTAPDKYVQKVISFNSTFPDQGDGVSPMDYINASFYQPVLVEMAISPLSPQAFSHYSFRYMGATLQGNNVIDKIEVTPKRKSQQLFEGNIFIVDDLWCLHSVDLTNENIAGKIRVRELYMPFESDIWMPVSHQIDIELAIIGIRADVGYGSSVKYSEVRPNTALEKPSEYALADVRPSSLPDTAVSKTARQIEKILSKEEMTNRDMVKLANLMEKQSEETLHDSVRNDLEIKQTTSRIVEKDAAGKDRQYWDTIRPIPLSDIEIRSLRKSDSLKAVRNLPGGQITDTVATGEKKRKGRFFRTIDHIAFGHNWSDKSGLSFSFGGLISPGKLNFNTVDGFVAGTDFRISKRLKNKNTISLYPDFLYPFARDRIMWRVNANYSTTGLHPGRIFINTGRISRDINSSGGINPFLNTVYSLLFRKNYMKLYESEYLTAGFEREIINGLDLSLKATFEERKILDNNSDFSIFRPSREYTDNFPGNDRLSSDISAAGLFSDQRHYELESRVTFTPFRKYRVYNGNKVPAGSEWPDFSLAWKHGLNRIYNFSDTYRHFDLLKIEVVQDKDVSAFSNVRWKVSAGGVVNGKNSIPFFDYFHFITQPPPVLTDDHRNAFMLPGYYSESTTSLFGEAHFRYKAPYVFLKLLPLLSNTLIRENLSFSLLAVRNAPLYTELGYSLSEVFLIGEIGIYTGFRNIKFDSVGLKFVLRLN